MAKSSKKTEETKPEEIKIETPPRRKRYRVCQGKSITCMKGILGPGAPVTAENVGGADCLEHLKETKHVEEYK